MRMLMDIKFIQVYFQGWIFFFFQLCCPGAPSHSFLPMLYVCQDQGRPYSWLQWLISLSPRCSWGSLFHWPPAPVSPLLGCQLSFCSSSLTINCLTPNWTLEGPLQSRLLHLVKNTEEQLQTGPNKARRQKTEDQGWAESRMPKFVITCRNSWCLGWVSRQDMEISVKWLLLESQRPRVTGESEFSGTINSGIF